MIRRWLEIVCDTCGNADYFKTWRTASMSGMVRKKVNGTFLHFCDSECLEAYMGNTE